MKSPSVRIHWNRAFLNGRRFPEAFCLNGFRKKANSIWILYKNIRSLCVNNLSIFFGMIL